MLRFIEKLGTKLIVHKIFMLRFIEKLGTKLIVHKIFAKYCLQMYLRRLVDD